MKKTNEWTWRYFRAKSADEAAERCVRKMEKEEILDFLKKHKVICICVGIEGKECAWLIIESDFVHYRVVLRPDRNISDWIEDLGHELGHLLAWEAGANGLSRGEQEFAEKFAIQWARLSINRMAARKIFCRLIKTGSLEL